MLHSFQHGVETSRETEYVQDWLGTCKKRPIDITLKVHIKQSKY